MSLALKYQYGYEYHTDNGQKLLKYKDYLSRNLATKHSTAKHGQNNQKELTRRSEGQPHLRNLTPVHKGCNPNLNPHSHWQTNDRNDVCFSQ